MPRCHLCRTPQECECARVASIPGLPVALPVWYWLPRAEREGTHHVQSSRAFELRSPPSSGSTSLSIVTRAPCHFFRFHFLVFSVLFSFIIVCAAAPAGGRGPGRARALAVWHTQTHWAVGSASGSGGPAPGRGPAIEIVIDNRLCILIYVCHTALWTSGELRRGPRFSWRRADLAGSHHRAPASTSHMKPCVEPDGVDLQTQCLRVRAIQPPETGLTRPSKRMPPSALPG